MSAPHVLVAYCTRSGSTAGVAQRIANRLREHGLEVDLRRMHAAGDPSGYDAVVLGSPVFDQHWMTEADDFVVTNERALAATAVWLFSVGSFGDTHRLVGWLMRQEPANARDLLSATGARGHRVFAGVIDRHVWPRAARVLFRALGGRFGDNRDWPAIDAWAASIAQDVARASTLERQWSLPSTHTD